MELLFRIESFVTKEEYCFKQFAHALTYFHSIAIPLMKITLHADIKLFADDKSLFSVVDDIGDSASKLSNDLTRIEDWAY